jgi:transcriptional regulator with XRE-family HTH domain
MEEEWYKKAKRLFRERKISQDKIGIRLGVEKASVSQKLNGKRTTTIDEVIIMADMLGMSMDELLSDDPKYTRNKQDLEIISKLRSISDADFQVFSKMINSLSND